MKDLCNWLSCAKNVESEEDEQEPTSNTNLDAVGPYIIHDDCGEGGRGVDLIFVHGLRGRRFGTWTKGNVCWPRDLLTREEDLRGTRIITWGYDAKIAQLFHQTSQESIFGHAETLLSDLARHRKGVVSYPFSQ